MPGRQSVGVFLRIFNLIPLLLHGAQLRFIPCSLAPGPFIVDVLGDKIFLFPIVYNRSLIADLIIHVQQLDVQRLQFKGNVLEDIDQGSVPGQQHLDRRNRFFKICIPVEGTQAAVLRFFSL